MSAVIEGRIAVRGCKVPIFAVIAIPLVAVVDVALRDIVQLALAVRYSPGDSSPGYRSRWQA
jgi:hypothetical protein